MKKVHLLKNEKGVTLLEMVLSLAIFMVLASIVLHSMPTYIERAMRIRAVQTGRAFRQAAEAACAEYIAEGINIYKREDLGVELENLNESDETAGNQYVVYYWNTDIGQRILKYLNSNAREYFGTVKTGFRTERIDFKVIVKDDGTFDFSTPSTNGSYVGVKLKKSDRKGLKYTIGDNKLAER